jgi:competence ComEA-like helix-hairpin-helix protein
MHLEKRDAHLTGNMTTSININTSTVKELTQLPGVAKNLAYRIVNHRNRHGYFTHWEELLEVKEFPADALDKIKQRANILPPAGIPKEEFGPRRIKTGHLERTAKKPKGYTKAIRATRSQDRLKPSA